MQVLVPYIEITDATKISLRGIEYIVVKMLGDYDYSRFFKKCWEKHEDFINVEHDSVLWPGAIDELKGCTEPWCAFDYASDTDLNAPNINSIPLGCMKFTKGF